MIIKLSKYGHKLPLYTKTVKSQNNLMPIFNCPISIDQYQYPNNDCIKIQ